jgi:hypothetical protein
MFNNRRVIINYMKFDKECFDFNSFIKELKLKKVELEVGVNYYVKISVVPVSADIPINSYKCKNSIIINTIKFILFSNSNASALLEDLFSNIKCNLGSEEGYCLVQKNGLVCHKIFYVKFYTIKEKGWLDK